MNSRTCRKGRQPIASVTFICAALGVFALPVRLHAQFTGTASATGQFESNSNVFALPSGLAPTGGDTKRSDTDFSYGAAFGGKYQFGRQQLFGSASVTEFDYQHFSVLDHTEYKIDTGLNWKVGDLWSGTLDVSRSRVMVPTYDLVGTTGTAETLSLVTSQSETALAVLKINSDWKVQGTVGTGKSEQPLPQPPYLIHFTQSTGSAEVDYVGLTGLSTGFQVAYFSGDYDGANNLYGFTNPSFSQITEAFTASYMHVRTTFGGQLGYSTRRSATATNDTSGFTGLLNLAEQLTPKTAVNFNVTRAINNYLLTAGSEIDTGAGAGITWQATYKLLASLSYTYTHRSYPAQGIPPFAITRTDNQQFASFGVNYQPRKWLMIRPYANLNKRKSNIIYGDFNQDIFGIAVTVSPPIRFLNLNGGI